MMTPYHYTVVRCRDPRIEGEYRNVGLLALAPTTRQAWLRKAVRGARTGLIGDDADFVDALLDGLLDQAKQLAKTEDAAAVHAWLRDRARPSEGTLSFTGPAFGIAEDLNAEVRRLREKMLGKSGGGSNAMKALQTSLLQQTGYASAFEPRELLAGPAIWRFSHVADTPHGPLVFVALQLAQKSPENILDATFKNVGRVHELTHYNQGLQFIGLIDGPDTRARGAAVARSQELIVNAGVQLLPHSVQGAQRILDWHFNAHAAAEAK